MDTTTALLWLLALPMGASPLVYLVGRVGARRSTAAGAWARWLTLAVLATAAIPLVCVGVDVLSGRQGVLWIGTVRLHMDGVGYLLAATVVALTTLVAIFSIPYMAGEDSEEKYYALLLVMMASMIGLGCAGDLFNLWVWFEAMAVSSYLLVAFHHRQRGALEAGVKYLVQSAAGSVLVLLGIALILAVTGTVDLRGIRAAVTVPTPPILAAGALFLVGFGVKTAIVPLHTWLPDAHSQAPSGISAMLSGVVIEAGLVAMLRALGCLRVASLSWGGLILGFGALSMIVGNLMALRQTEVKRLLAYSSVSHVGYMLVGFGVAAGFGVTSGATGGFFHLLTHALMKGLAFLAAGSLLYSLHLAKGRHVPLMVEDLDGAATRHPVTAFTFTVALLALGGLPPLAGFMSKWQIFVAGFETRDALAAAIVVFAAFNSVLSLGYYAPLINRMYRHTPSPAVTASARSSTFMNVPLVALSAALVVLGLWPGLAEWVTAPAGAGFISIFGGL